MSLDGQGSPPKEIEDIPLDEDDDEVMDETVVERLVGLTEMFPEGLRNFCSQAVSLSGKYTVQGYGLTRNLLWVATSAATLLVLPVVFEKERAQHQEQQRQQERQILLGPNAAMGGSSPMMPGMMPPMPPTS
ncbi:mitochondrial import receptor subunit TOM22 homolog [Mytilus edulis]|uniref:mitochondrial import receptor subunit TOM22 homolog n=1 Tax=Mytilus edulis TaxID=6550 RepID=UPI0039EF1ACF